MWWLQWNEVKVVGHKVCCAVPVVEFTERQFSRLDCCTDKLLYATHMYKQTTVITLQGPSANKQLLTVVSNRQPTCLSKKCLNNEPQFEV